MQKNQSTLVACCFWVLFFVADLPAQEAFQVPSRFSGMANASVSLQSPLAASSKPAGIANTNSLSLGIHLENRFFLNELGLSFAKKLSSDFAVGLQFHYFSIHLPKNDRHPEALSVNIGFQIKLKNGLFMGEQLFNPYPLPIQTQYTTFHIPQIIGLEYALKEFQSDIDFQYHQDLEYSPSFNLYYSLP